MEEEKEEKDNKEEDKEESDEEEYVIKKKEILCEICNQTMSKYSCPACNIRTCCLTCVKKHKEFSKCTGIKPRSEFLQISEFTDDVILRDYFFLKEVERLAGDSHFLKHLEKKRKKSNNKNEKPNKRRKENEIEDENQPPPPSSSPPSPPPPPPPPMQNLPVSLKKLINEAKNRDINLLIMPFGLSRRDNNTSYFDYKKKTLSWRVEWIFYPHQYLAATHNNIINNNIINNNNSNDDNNSYNSINNNDNINNDNKEENNNNKNNNKELSQYLYVNERIEDMTILRELLNDNLDSCKEKHKKQISEYYNFEDRDKIELLMKVVDTPANNTQYFQLNKNDSLRAALAHKTIIEFPTLIVCLPQHLSAFNISW